MNCPCCSALEPCASKISIFKHLDLKSREEISNIAIHSNKKKGELLFSPNKTDGLYLIAKGKVKVYELTPSGKEYLIRVLNEGDFVGEEALFGKEETYTFGEALVDTQVCFIGREAFLDLLIRYPSISLKLLEEFNRRMVHASHQATTNMSENVMKRLGNYLLKLSLAQDSHIIEIPLSLKELSSYLNTTPETLSRRLAELEKKNIVSRKGRKIVIKDLKVLELMGN